jgi:prevent-host-death family protein
MSRTYSISEAKNRLSEFVRTVEQGETIQLTRRGKVVAELHPALNARQLKAGKVDFWEAYLAFRREHNLEELDLDVDAIFADVRDRSAPTEAHW